MRKLRILVLLVLVWVWILSAIKKTSFLMKSALVPVCLLRFCKVFNLLGIALVSGTMIFPVRLVFIGGLLVNKFLELFSVLVTAGEALYRAFRNLKKFFKGDL